MIIESWFQFVLQIEMMNHYLIISSSNNYHLVSSFSMSLISINWSSLESKSLTLCISNSHFPQDSLTLKELDTHSVTLIVAALLMLLNWLIKSDCLLSRLKKDSQGRGRGRDVEEASWWGPWSMHFLSLEHGSGCEGRCSRWSWGRHFLQVEQCALRARLVRDRDRNRNELMESIPGSIPPISVL